MRTDMVRPIPSVTAAAAAMTDSGSRFAVHHRSMVP
jgi:hypothetical protein